MVMEEAREMRLHYCDFKHGEEPIWETWEQMIARVDVIRQCIYERTKAQPGLRVLVAAHHNTFRHLFWNDERGDGIYLDNAEIREMEI